MATSQTLIFTLIPRGISQNPQTYPVSLLVSPRLRGADKLGDFPEWLEWTRLCQERGLKLTLECAGQTLNIPVPTAQLRPDLWAELFNRETLVRTHQFDDYSGRFIASYPQRAALSSLKGIYQAAGVALALPEESAEGHEQLDGRGILRGLLDGYAVDWDSPKGRRWREEQRKIQQGSQASSLRTGTVQDGLAGQLGSDGLLKAGALEPGSSQAKQLNQGVAERFAVYNHMPQGAPLGRESLDENKVLDFHQVLGSLGSYPQLQRSLGLIFDLELPQDFVTESNTVTPGILSVVKADFGDQRTPTVVPKTQTAYLNFKTENGERYFCTAPRALLTKNEPMGVFGLLFLEGTRFGLAQVDVDGGLHKTVMLAEGLHQTNALGEAPAQYPEVFDPTATLASLRSGGLSLYADSRALELLKTFGDSKKFNQALENNQPQPRAFAAEDLMRGFRLDIWDAQTGAWHSLHRRNGTYVIGEQTLQTEDEEGFVQLAATQVAPEADGSRANNDLYLHEAMARWSGWSLSADRPGKHLTRHPDPERAVPDPANPDPENEPITPFKLQPTYTVVPGSLPRLRFGGRYRVRARAVDLAGNSLELAQPLTDALSLALGLPQGNAVFPYLRFEPVAAPTPLVRQVEAITGPGSALERLVIRSYNASPEQDGIAADLSANDRHIAPPRGSVELGERHGIFDKNGKLNPHPAMWNLIKTRDQGQFNKVKVDSLLIDGEKQEITLEPAPKIALPYLPDPQARGAAFRNLPGTPQGTLARVEPGTGAASEVDQQPLQSANPRPGSATLVGFGGKDDWQGVAPFRLALEEGRKAPQWNPAERLLTVYLPKGQTAVTPLSSFMEAEDLKRMGVWQWLREYLDFMNAEQPLGEFYRRFGRKDRATHIVQRAKEGGHWMLTPPTLLTLVHAVQQPLGIPQFTRVSSQYRVGSSQLQTQPEGQPTAETELNPLNAWRVLGSTDAYLLGGLSIHGASTAKIDLEARWEDPVDDPLEDLPSSQTFSSFVDQIPLTHLQQGEIQATGTVGRAVAHYDPEQDLLVFARGGSELGQLQSGESVWRDAAPRHALGDTKHHVVRYRAVTTSRYREYFPPGLEFTRSSPEVEVQVPASARPLAPQIAYVIPTFGWQRDTQTNLKRSLRMGGGLRVYLQRPWFSSGEGELLGVALYSSGERDYETTKGYLSQWGQDPLWQTAALPDYPGVYNFPQAVAQEYELPLEHGRKASVAGHPVAFDPQRKLWYCDLSIDPRSPTYAPFVRLALVRYQPQALVEAKLSRPVPADFVQLTPERAATLNADPYNPNTLRLVVSGPAPQNNQDRSLRVSVEVQERIADLPDDLGWQEVPPGNLSITPANPEAPLADEPNLMRWMGLLRFARPVKPGQYRLVIREHEFLPADDPEVQQGGRLIYAETFLLDAGLLEAPPLEAASTHLGM